MTDMMELTRQYGRYGNRRITAPLRDAGWRVNAKRMERLSRRGWLNVSQNQPNKRRSWLHHGSRLRLRLTSWGHVRSYDFIHPRTDDLGRSVF